MKTKMTLLGLGLLLMTACKDEQKEAVAEPAATPTEERQVTADSVKINPAHGLPGHTCELPVGAPLNSATAKATPVKKQPSTSVSPIRIDQRPELNPPHGEPYHDCSIPVGGKLKKS
ncbi:MAG: hypothetical protein WBL21_06115 [Salinimicrobium sp.]